jgi:Replication-relaxation
MSASGPTSQPVPGRPSEPQRVRLSHVEWVAERLSDRDWQIIEAMNRMRLMSGSQLERLCFAALAGHARTVVRGRVLRRLVHWQVLTILPRRIGGAARGSSGSVFALGAAGARLCAERPATTTTMPRVRHPGAPTERSVRHTLAVSELFVGLVEHAYMQGAQVIAFEAEPASWWPNGLGGFIKPDAYAVLTLRDVREHWWVEVDLATESLPTIKRKLLAYLDFIERGQLGPGKLVPRVLVSTVTAARCVDLRSVIAKLPPPAADLFVALSHHEAAAHLVQSLQE